jgi:threonine dehydratase
MTTPANADQNVIPQRSDLAKLIQQAYQRVGQHLKPTRMVYDPNYNLWLKCEHEQQTGSFKWRGALARLSNISPGQIIVTASTGNHGLAVSNAAKVFGHSAIVFISSNASNRKVEKLKLSGAQVIAVEGDSLVAELAGKAYANTNSHIWVSPYNDLDVISGQGTIGLEIDRQLQDINKIYVTVGGGGLISGIASWLKNFHPEVEMIACQPSNSPEMYLSVQAGHVVTAPDAADTLSDGSAGPLEIDSITFPICRREVDRFILITEKEIRDAIRYLYEAHHMVVEGAAGVAMAAAQKEVSHNSEIRSVVVLCGGNIDPAIHADICHSER